MISYYCRLYKTHVMRLLTIILAATAGLTAQAGVIVLEGNYQGKNIFIQNPFSEAGVGFVDATMSGNAEFLFPSTATAPDSRRPPSTRSIAINPPILERRERTSMPRRHANAAAPG